MNDDLRTGAKSATKNVFYWVVTALVLVFTGLIAAYYFFPSPYENTAELAKLKNRTLTIAELPYLHIQPERPKFLVWNILPANVAPINSVFAVLSPRTDWPQWRGPARNGVAASGAFRSDWPKNGPPILWKKQAGDGFSSFAVADDRVLTIMQDGGNEAVVCWHVETGRELWRFRYPARYRNSWGSGPRSTPTIDGNLVYTVGATGIMHCLKLYPGDSQGESVWSSDLLLEFGANNLRWGVSFSPLVEGDLVFAMPGGPNGNGLAAFKKTTGKLAWKTADDQAGYSSPIAATIHGQRQILFFTATGLVAVEPKTGNELWRYGWTTDHGCNIATPIIVDDYVFISSGYNHGCALLRIERDDDSWDVKRVYENRRMRTHFSTCVLVGDHLYGFDNDKLTCMAFRTGEVQWKQRGFGKGSLIASNGHLIILGANGRLALAKADADAYREIAGYSFSNTKCWAPPVLADRRLFVRDMDRVVCLDLR